MRIPLIEGTSANMREKLLLVDNRVMRPAQTVLALELLGEMDLLRLKAIARLYARGLPPDVSWEDLIQEALTRLLVGSRVQPQGLETVAFVAGVIRSLRADYCRRAHRRAPGRTGRLDEGTEALCEGELRETTPSPERALTAVQELAAIERLFSGDPTVLQIIAGLGEGHSAEQIREKTGLTRTEYDSARKRMRRSLLREGLTWAEK